MQTQDAVRTVTCHYEKCGKPFVPRRGANQRNRFCSSNCKSRHHRTVDPSRDAREQRTRYAANPARWRDYSIKKKYGLTREDYLAILEAQGGACKVCRMKPEPGEFLRVDHCHKTNRTRGLLCNACNVGIGFLRDSPKILRGAIRYLEQCELAGFGRGS